MRNEYKNSSIHLWRILDFTQRVIFYTKTFVTFTQLDHWQKPHHKTKSSIVTAALDHILALGANVNIYMYHGGTSFGFTAGANIDGNMYDPCPTSYDYDAPLSEAGDPTAKYFAIKETISKVQIKYNTLQCTSWEVSPNHYCMQLQYLTVPKENPDVTPKAAYGRVYLQPYTSLHDPEFLTLFAGRSVVS